MDLRPVDRLLGAWVALVTVVILVRGGVGRATVWLLAAHLLFGVLLLLFSRLQSDRGAGGALRDLYPLVLLSAFYSELGILAVAEGLGATFAHDVTVQGWEAALFGQQISYAWIRSSPSAFWSGLLHLAYMTYYPIILAGPVVCFLRRRRGAARRVVFALMLSFVLCYLVFLFFPVAGPNYAFSEPTGGVRDVWSADLVYGLLGAGSAFGTAFPSSHVAATVASVGAVWREDRTLSGLLAGPAALMVVSTIYCQMHYGVDVLVGLVVGVLVLWIAGSTPSIPSGTGRPR